MPRTHDLRTKLKRQIEIVGLCADPANRYKVVDLAILFNCQELTIKRDLQDLRSSGIDIHSVPRKGVSTARALQPAKMKELITQYTALSAFDQEIDKATSVLVGKQKTDALRNIVLLQRCIDEGITVKLDYEKVSGEISKGRELHPARLFRADGQWRLIASDNGVLKQFLVTKMNGIRQTERRFRQIPTQEVDALFLNSFRSFLGTDRFPVRLHLSKRWAGIIKPRQHFEQAEVIERKDGSIDMLIVVNNLQEIAGWVVARGKGITVLEPEELKVMVIELAKGTLKNYR